MVSEYEREAAEARIAELEAALASANGRAEGYRQACEDAREQARRYEARIAALSLASPD